MAVLNHCRYTASHRCTSALSKGVTPEELRQVASRHFENLSEREQVALALADEMTTSIPDLRVADSVTGVMASVREQAANTFEPAELVELAMCISVWNALSRFHRVMEFDLDMPEAPADVEVFL